MCQKKSAGIIDKKIKCNQKSIEVGTIQGLGPSNKKQIPELPNPLRDHNNTANVQATAKLQNKMTFYSKLNLAINSSFLPQSTKVAQAAVEYLKENGSDLVCENINVEKNSIVACK